MPTIPNGFVPNVSAYSHDDPGGVMRTEVEGGFSRYGLDWDRGTMRYSITMVIDLFKYSVWTTFYHHIIKKGAISFDMPLDTGYGSSTHSVNILPGSYSASRTAGNCVVISFSVEAESEVYDITPSEAAEYVAFYNLHGSEAQSILQRIGVFATVDTLPLDL